MDITVSGTAETRLAPERATLHLSVSFEGADRSSVVTATTDRVARVAADAEALRADSSVATVVVLPMTTSTWVPYSEGEPKAPQVSASADLRVEFVDVEALSAFADRWAVAPGVHLGNVVWELTDEHRAQAEAEVLGQAVAKAVERARVIATAAGLSDVELLAVADPGMLGTARTETRSASFAAMARSAKEGGGIDLRPEDVVVTATVDARLRAV